MTPLGITTFVNEAHKHALEQYWWRLREPWKGSLGSKAKAKSQRAAVRCCFTLLAQLRYIALAVQGLIVESGI